MPGGAPHDLFRTIVDHAPVGIGFAGPTGDLEYANDRWRTLANYHGPLPVGTGVLIQLVHPDDRERTLAAFTNSLNDSAEFRESIRMIGDDTPNVLVAFRSVRNDRGEPIGYLVGLSDISELSAAAEEARRSEERFRLVASSLPVGVYRVTPSGRILWGNERLSEITGTPTEDGAGTSVFGYTHPDDYDNVVQASREAAARGERLETRHRIITTDGQIKWVLSRSSPIRDADGHAVEYVGSIEDITELHRESEQLAHRAAHDPLTDLPNRARLISLIESLVDQSPNRNDLGIVFIDLDRFKEINDTWGHHAGDLVLIEVAQRLASVIRSADTVGRYGGDEFVVVCPGVDDITALYEVAGRISDVVAATPFEVAGHKHSLTASAGVALGPGQQSVEALLGQADTAMYEAKRDAR